MSPDQFHLWLKGFLDACPEQPTPFQCKRIREELSKVVEAPKYVPYFPYVPSYTIWPGDQWITISGTSTSELMNDPNLSTSTDVLYACS